MVLSFVRFRRRSTSPRASVGVSVRCGPPHVAEMGRRLVRLSPTGGRGTLDGTRPSFREGSWKRSPPTPTGSQSTPDVPSDSKVTDWDLGLWTGVSPVKTSRVSGRWTTDTGPTRSRGVPRVGLGRGVGRPRYVFMGTESKWWGVDRSREGDTTLCPCHTGLDLFVVPTGGRPRPEGSPPLHRHVQTPVRRPPTKGPTFPETHNLPCRSRHTGPDLVPLNPLVRSATPHQTPLDLRSRVHGSGPRGTPFYDTDSAPPGRDGYPRRDCRTRESLGVSRRSGVPRVRRGGSEEGRV